MGSNNFGGSLLPSHGANTYKVRSGKHGKLKVMALPEVETHALLYLSPANEEKIGPDAWTLLATHSNGHSCENLADRIILAWDGKRDADYPLSQFIYILNCGGTARQHHILELVVAGEY